MVNVRIGMVSVRALARIFFFSVFIMMVALVVMKWRSGTTFERYRNWRGQWVSVPDAPEALVLGGVILVVFVAGGVLWWWDRRRENRFIKEMKNRKGPPSRPPGE